MSPCLQAVLGSLGGVTLLFPLLEQVALPVAERGGEVAEKTERGLVTEQSAGSPARWYGGGCALNSDLTLRTCAVVCVITS